MESHAANQSPHHMKMDGAGDGNLLSGPFCYRMNVPVLAHPFLRASVGGQPRLPRGNGNYVSLPGKDFGEKDPLDFFITIDTAIG